MSNKTFILDLAKLAVSAAWADGELSNEEVNALKDLLFCLDDVSAEDWTVLSMYMDSPTKEAENEELIERVLKAIRTSKDKALVLETLENLFRSDGKVTHEEQALLDQIKSDVLEISTGIFSGFSKALKSAIRVRSASVRASCLREHESGDYVENTIFYDLNRKRKEEGVAFDQPEAELRKMCLATGLLSHVANVDKEISSEEQEAIRAILAEDWGLFAEQADLLAGIGCDRATRGLDYSRLSHGFFECTTFEERAGFLKTLFRVANASNKTDNDEIEAIRHVAKSLKLSNDDFIDAKLTIPREDRRGL